MHETSLPTPPGQHARLLPSATILALASAAALPLLTLSAENGPAEPILAMILVVLLLMRYLTPPQYLFAEGKPSASVPWLLLGLGLMGLLSLLLPDSAILYCSLIGLEGYLLLAPERPRWGVVWIGGAITLGLLCRAFLVGWNTTTPTLWGLPGSLFLLALGESLVRARTSECRAAVAEGKLEQACEQVQGHVAQSEKLIVTQERAYLAREIQDSLGHTVAALDVQLELLIWSFDSHLALSREAAEQSRLLVKESLVEVRRAMQALHQTQTVTFSLHEVVTSLVENFQETTRVPVRCQIEGEIEELSPRLTFLLYRTVEEVLTTVATYASLGALTLTVICGAESILVSIESEHEAQGMSLDFCLPRWLERAEVFVGEFHPGFTPQGRLHLEFRFPR